MFAVVKTGGKQYIVKEGDVLDIEKIEGKEGSTASLDQVLLVADDNNVQVGTPLVRGAEVEVEIMKQFKDKKVEIMKFKKKTGYRRKRGHRQVKTKVEVKKIKA